MCDIISAIQMGLERRGISTILRQDPPDLNPTLLLYINPMPSTIEIFYIKDILLICKGYNVLARFSLLNTTLMEEIISVLSNYKPATNSEYLEYHTTRDAILGRI